MCAGPGSGQGQPPRMSYRLRDVLKSSYRAVPVRLYLGVMGRGLKCGGQRLHPLRQPLQRLGDRGIGRGFYRPAATLASLLQFIGEKERGIEKLTGFAEAAQRAGGVAGLAVDDRGDRAQMRLLAVAAGDRTFAGVDLDLHGSPGYAPSPPTLTRSNRSISPS